MKGVFCILCLCAQYTNSQNRYLTCYTDFNRNITCLWNSKYVSDDTACTIDAQYKSRRLSSCHLKPVDVSRPALKKCSLIFEIEYTFLSFHELSLKLNLNQMKSLITSFMPSFMPSCHIKVNPPAEPKVNFTSVSWLSQVHKHERISSYRSELQWKKQDQSWSLECEKQLGCKAELEQDLLIQGERYEARVRVRSVEPHPEGDWSDWSPTASWESPVGKIKPTSGTFISKCKRMNHRYFLCYNMLLLHVIIPCPPIPDPGKSFLREIQRLFGSSGGVFGKFIQVCSDYERVEKQQADSPELPSLDSGVSSGGEEQLSQDEGMEDADKSTESTRFLFPPHPSSALPCSLLSFPQLPLNLPGPRLSPALQRQPGHMTQGFALMSTGRSVEPSGDGYMPVKQEEG
ncbi:ATP-dependent DNA helicase PIF1 [Sarotherodon galilaeus]